MDRCREIARDCGNIRAGLRLLYLPTERGQAVADHIGRLAHCVEALAMELREARVEIAALKGKKSLTTHPLTTQGAKS